MSRVQLSLNVTDLGAAVAFYSRLLGAGPAKLRPSYANFAIDDPPLKLVLNCPGNGPGGSINHLGVEVTSTEEVADAGTRMAAEGLDTEPEPGAVCCYALQDKVWAHDPDGLAWEYYTVLETHRGTMTPPPSGYLAAGAGRLDAGAGGGGGGENAGLAPLPTDWLRLARLARALSWITLAWMGVEGGVAIGAALIAGSAALLGFGLDSGIEAIASVIVIWRFTGARLASPASERRARKLVAASFFLLAPYIAYEAISALAAGDRAETSIAGLVLTAGTAIFEPALGLAKRRIGARLGSAATAGEGTQNLLCAYLAIAVFAGLAANALSGAWWLDGAVALGIAAWAVIEGRRAWAGHGCACATRPGAQC